MTRILQPWLHDYDITVDGPVTIVAERSGDLGAPATGIIVDDRRVVRTLQLFFDDVACVPVASSAVGSISEHWSVARHLGGTGPDPTVEVRRRRAIDALVVTETITVQSRHDQTVSTTMTMLVGGDGADIGHIKMGHDDTPQLVADPERVRWNDERHDTDITARPAPGKVTGLREGGLCLSWPVIIEPSGSVTIELTWTFRRRQETDFDADAGSQSVDWDAEHLADSTRDPRLGELVRVGLTDLRHLTLRDPLAADDIVAAAGTPWYLTLFGRDAIWTARLMASHSHALVGGTLRSLARRQAHVADIETAAEPGKILHELRRTSATSERLGLPSLYYGTVDATPLWIALLHDGWQTGMPEREIVELLPNLDAALTWMKHTVEAAPDGLLRYADLSQHGLANQGWKDSADSMRRADGSIAKSPIALIEAQAYAVQAALTAAELGAAFGLAMGFWRQWADDLAARVRERFWIGTGDDAYLAMALDGDGQPVDGVASNMGHALGTGILTPDESARVVARLLRPDMLRDFGIGTLSSENPAYNPIGYHTGSIWAHDTAIIATGMARAGFNDEAAIVAERLLRLGAECGYRMPELCGGEAVGRRPVPYPAACRPQAWAAAAAVAVHNILQ
ncbi:MAG: glycogen debranching N-terminal domain-containing protein [Ilumatobacteraceae bacterium]